jgi:hypothetical protein
MDVIYGLVGVGIWDKSFVEINATIVPISEKILDNFKKIVFGSKKI